MQFTDYIPVYRKSKNTITHSAVSLSIPLDEEAGAVPDDHPLQMGRHDEPVHKTRYYTHATSDRRNCTNSLHTCCHLTNA